MFYIWNLSSHILFIDSCVYFNSKNLDLFVQVASSTTDTDSILSSCLAFSQVWNPRPLTKVSKHTKTLPSVITQAGVTLLALSQLYSLFWRATKCHSPEVCVEMNSKPKSRAHVCVWAGGSVCRIGLRKENDNQFDIIIVDMFECKSTFFFLGMYTRLERDGLTRI